MADVIRGRKEVDEIENKLKELIHEYEMFFQGIERVEPEKKRDDVKRLLQKMYGLKLNNAIVKQKFANLISRFNTYQHQWDNVLLQIERGTYRRELAKIKLKEKLKSSTDDSNEDEQLNQNRDDSQKSYQNEQPKEKNYEQIHKQYQMAQKLLGSDSTIDFEKMKERLKQQEEMIKEKYKCKDVEFKIVVKEGKATIRPIIIE
jgi:Mn-containing catalase